MIEPILYRFPHLFQPSDGPELDAEWGSLLVPQNRESKVSELVSIPFVRFPSTSKNPGPPIFYQQGGPGISSIKYLDNFWSKSINKPPLHLGDIVFVEQRGAGLSKPSLDNPGVITIPLETPGTEELYSEAAYQFLSNAVHYWGSRGLDLGGYNVREMAADIDDVRRALGYDIITLLGGSFGSHHSLTYMRDFGQHVHRAFLWSIEGPNHTVKLPSNIQVHLERLADMFAEHFPLQPNLLELLAEVMERLENKPVRCETLHPSTLEPRVVSLGKYDLQLTLANGLGSTPFLEQLPSRIHQLVKGEYSWLAEQVIRERTHPDINLMFAVTDYASGATQARKEQILAEAPQAMLGNAINDPFHQFSDLFGAYDLGDQFRENYHSEVETLLVSGSLDARTPISNAEEVVSSLPNGSRVVIEGTSHDLSWRGDHVAELGALRNSFLEHGSVSSHKIKSGFKFEALV